MNTLPVSGWAEAQTGLRAADVANPASVSGETYLDGKHHELPSELPDALSDIRCRDADPDGLVIVDESELKVVLDVYNRCLKFLSATTTELSYAGLTDLDIDRLEAYALDIEETGPTAKAIPDGTEPWQTSIAGEEIYAKARRARIKLAEYILYMLEHPDDTTAKSVAREFSISQCLNDRQRIDRSEESANTSVSSMLRDHKDVRLPQQVAAADFDPGYQPGLRNPRETGLQLARFIAGHDYFYTALANTSQSLATKSDSTAELDQKTLIWHLHNLDVLVQLADRVADITSPATLGDEIDNLADTTDACYEKEYTARNYMAWMVLHLVSGQSTDLTKAIAKAVAQAELDGTAYVPDLPHEQQPLWQ